MTNYVNQKDEQLNLQRQKVAEQQEAGRQFRFIGGQQFFSSMRDVGYGNEGQALMDIIDNGIEAGATEIHVLIQNDGPRGRIEAMAVADNGHGMDPAWLEASIGFGSTSRGTKRDGLGRFGMGLSSAGIAFSELLEVYSHSADSNWHRTFIDLRAESETCFTDDYLETVLDFRPPKATEKSPPSWVMDSVGHIVKESGTVVALSGLTPDRRKWSFKDFKTNLARAIGVTYHKMAGDLTVFINGDKVQFIDPLFITKGMKGYDLDQDRAEAMPANTIEISDPTTGESFGMATVRFSVMPPTFALKSEFKDKKGTSAQETRANGRFNVMRDYNGVILVRNGRVIGVDSKAPTRFGNNDYNIGVELEFSGLADDLFGVTTLKNKVSLKKEAWDALAQVGLTRGIQAARARRKELFADWNAEVAPTVSDGDGNDVRPMEIAASGENREPRKPVPADTAERIRQVGETNLEQEVKRRATNTGKPEVVVRQEIVAEIHDRDFVVEFQSLRGSDFISFEPIGIQTKLVVNSDHAFYKNLFGSEHTTGYGKEALGLVLTSFFRAMTLTHIGQAEGGRPLFDSQVFNHLMRNWSETMENQMSRLEGLMSPDAVDFEDGDEPSETNVAQ